MLLQQAQCSPHISHSLMSPRERKPNLKGFHSERPTPMRLKPPKPAPNPQALKSVTIFTPAMKSSPGTYAGSHTSCSQISMERTSQTRDQFRETAAKKGKPSPNPQSTT